MDTLDFLKAKLEQSARDSAAAGELMAKASALDIQVLREQIAAIHYRQTYAFELMALLCEQVSALRSA